ncbi:MAG: ASPIC/UnbV domain-containing protein, partial [Flavobacteriales bacterium]
MSNRNGIGTRYEYWIGEEKLVGYTYCGEGYLTQNSQNINLGLGTASAIDSLKLFWISGVEDVYYNLPANTFQLLVEGETKQSIVSSKDEICVAQDSIQLSVTGWPLVLWDNGSTNPQRTVYLPGIYTAVVSTGFGHSIQLSKEITESAQPLITSSTVQPSCFGSSDGQLQVEWHISNETSSIVESNLSSGFHSLEIPYGQGCSTEVDLVLSEPSELIVFTSANAANCSNENSGSIEIVVSGGTPPYSLGEGTDFVIEDLFASEYNGVVTDANGCAVSWSTTIEEPTPIVISSTEEMPSAWNEGSIILTVEGGAGSYSYDWSNGNLTAENLNLQAGDYFVTVTDGNGCTADIMFSLIFNNVNSLNLNTMNWT